MCDITIQSLCKQSNNLNKQLFTLLEHLLNSGAQLKTQENFFGMVNRCGVSWNVLSYAN